MGWFSNYHRHPKTTQELRELHGSRMDQREEEEYDIPLIRAKRRGIPTAWDDQLRTGKEDRSWKRYRKTQWKPKKDKKKRKTSKFRGFEEVSTCWGWKGRQHFDKKRVWSWKWTRIGQQWDPNKPYWHYCYRDGQYRSELRYGCYVDVYGWKWVGLTPRVTITNGYKTTEYPELKKSDNGVNYFTGKWLEKKKKLAS